MKFHLLLASATLTLALPVAAQDGQALLDKHGCTQCHAMQGDSAVPGWAQISKKYKGNADAVADIIAAIKQGEHGDPVSMPPTPNVPRADATAMAQYIVGVAKK